jgi:F0F1-type ATP synthase membrane subunit b/b'
VQAHLGKEEVKQELEKLEKEIDGLVAKAKSCADEAEQTVENTGAALKMAAEELRGGIDRLRKLSK